MVRFRKNKGLLRVVCLYVAISFFSSAIFPNSIQAQEIILPAPTQFVPLSNSYSFPVLKGMKFDPADPLKMEFIIDTQDKKKVTEEEAGDLIKYFLAGLTIPEQDIWVNMSPFEKDRMITPELAQTDLGKDLLSQDYILKQISASLTYPESDTGKDFWEKTYQEVLRIAKTTKLPVNTFNKIWIVPNEAEVYENGNFALITKASLKVMLEEDYLALKNNISDIQKKKKNLKPGLIEEINTASSRVVRETILPKINQEVNSGKNFATLRQIYHSLILGMWFKQKFQESIYRDYINKGKLKGIDLADKDAKEKIYNLYIEAFKKGLYNYVKSEYEPGSQRKIKRQYYSGGFEIWPNGSSPLKVSYNRPASSPLRGPTEIAHTNFKPYGASSLQPGQPRQVSSPLTTAVAGNWKLRPFKDEETARAKARKFRDGLADIGTKAEIVLFVADEWMKAISEELEGSNIEVGVQSFHFDPAGTGSADVIKQQIEEAVNKGAKYAMVGHSMHQKPGPEVLKALPGLVPLTNERANQIVKAILADGRLKLWYVIAVDEHKGIPFSEQEDYIRGQIDNGVKIGLDGVSAEQLSKIKITVEPMGDISTPAGDGVIDPKTKVNFPKVEMLARLWAEAISNKFGETAVVNTGYGATVTPDTAKTLSSHEKIFNLLPGGMSLEVKNFRAIIVDAIRGKVISRWQQAYKAVDNLFDRQLKAKKKQLEEELEASLGHEPSNEELKKPLQAVAKQVSNVEHTLLGMLINSGKDSVEGAIQEVLREIQEWTAPLEQEQEPTLQINKSQREYLENFRQVRAALLEVARELGIQEPEFISSPQSGQAEQVSLPITLDMSTNFNLLQSIPEAIQALKGRDLMGKRVLVRVNTNIRSENGRLEDMTRIYNMLPIINFLLLRGATPILFGHNGRLDKENKKDDRQSLVDVANNIKRHFRRTVFHENSVTEEGLKITKDDIKMGQPNLIENVRFADEYELGAKRKEFAQALINLSDGIFIFDAFGDIGSEGASVEDVPLFAQEVYVGPAMVEEFNKLKDVLKEGIDALAFGGVKLEKTKLLRRLLQVINPEGFALIGSGPSSELSKTENKDLIQELTSIRPEGFIVAQDYSDETRYDIGEKTIETFLVRLDTLKEGQTVVDNGTMGYMSGKYTRGTQIIYNKLKELARRGVKIIVFGGDASATSKKYELDKEKNVVTFSGGGVPLQILGGETLSGLEALSKRQQQLRQEALQKVTSQPGQAGQAGSSIYPIGPTGAEYLGMQQLINQIGVAVRNEDLEALEKLVDTLIGEQRYDLVRPYEELHGDSADEMVLSVDSAIEKLKQLKGEGRIEGGILLIGNGFREGLSVEEAIAGLEKGDYLARYYSIGHRGPATYLFVLYSTAQGLMNRFKSFQPPGQEETASSAITEEQKAEIRRKVADRYSYYYDLGNEKYVVEWYLLGRFDYREAIGLITEKNENLRFKRGLVGTMLNDAQTEFIARQERAEGKIPSMLGQDIRVAVRNKDLKALEKLAPLLMAHQERAVINFDLIDYNLPRGASYGDTGTLALSVDSIIKELKQVVGKSEGILNGFGERLSVEKAIAGLEKGDYVPYKHSISRTGRGVWSELTVLYFTPQGLMNRFQSSSPLSQEEAIRKVVANYVEINSLNAVKRTKLELYLQDAGPSFEETVATFIADGQFEKATAETMVKGAKTDVDRMVAKEKPPAPETEKFQSTASSAITSKDAEASIILKKIEMISKSVVSEKDINGLVTSSSPLAKKPTDESLKEYIATFKKNLDNLIRGLEGEIDGLVKKSAQDLREPWQAGAGQEGTIKKTIELRYTIRKSQLEETAKFLESLGIGGDKIEVELLEDFRDPRLKSNLIAYEQRNWAGSKPNHIFYVSIDNRSILIRASELLEYALEKMPTYFWHGGRNWEKITTKIVGLKTEELIMDKLLREAVSSSSPLGQEALSAPTSMNRNPGGIDLQGINVKAAPASSPVSIPMLDFQNLQGLTFQIIRMESITNLNAFFGIVSEEKEEKRDKLAHLEN